MEDMADKAKGWVELVREIKQTINPYAWAKSFRDSYRSYKGGVAQDQLIDGCRQLVEAMGRLERTSKSAPSSSFA